MRRNVLTIVEQPNGGHKTPSYQKRGMHYEWRFERLARYAARPAVSTERLSELPDGRLLCRLKRRWQNGTTAIVFDRSDFIAKLAALVPAPRAHLVRYHGIVGPAKWRSLIVPSPDLQFDACGHISAHPAVSVIAEDKSTASESAPQPKRKNYSWAALLKRVFDMDMVRGICGGPVRVIAAIEEPETVEKILKCLGLPSRPPPLRPARQERHFSAEYF